MAMTNKEYKQARERAEEAEELYTFENEHFNGFRYWISRYMTPEDLKDIRKEYKNLKENERAFALEGFGGRAVILPDVNTDGLILQSYYTKVCRYDIQTGLFEKTWDGFSVTTLKHVNIFREFLGLSKLSKREWIELETV